MRLAFAYVKYWMWQIVVKGMMGLVAFALTSEGLRIINPGCAQKLSGQPFLVELNNYEGFYRLEVAHLFALGLVLGVFICWTKAIRAWLKPDDTGEKGFSASKYRLFTIPFAVVFLSMDSICFYKGVAQMGWGGGGFSVDALLATAMYASLAILTCFVSVMLRQRILNLQEQS
jgi:hypothetical protein